MKILLLASAAALVATTAIAATAAEATQAPPAAAPTAPAADTSGVSDADVQKVAMVGAAIQKLTTDTKDATLLSNQEAQALKDQAITFEQFNAVASKAQGNPALAARLSKAHPSDSDLNTMVAKIKSEVGGPAPSASAAPTSTPAASAAGASAPASATALDPKTSPADPSLSHPAPPPGVNDVK